MKPRIPRWARIVIETTALGLLVLLFVILLDVEEVRGLIRRVTWQVIVGVLGFQIGLQVLGSFQWGLILREARIHRGPWQVFWARVSGFAVTYLTPSMYFGGEPVRASVYKTDAMSYQRLYATIALDKYIELSTKFPCIIAGFAFLVFLAHPSAGLVIVAAAILLGFIGFFVFLIAKLFTSPTFIVTFAKRLIRPLARVHRRVAVKVLVAIKEFSRDVAEIIRRTRTFTLAMATGVLVAVTEVFQTWFILGVLDPAWPGVDRLIRSFVIFATVFIQALVGVLPGNLGGMEGTHLLVFNVLGLGSTRSLMYTIILRIGQMTMTALGILWIVGWRVRRARQRGADRNRTDA